MAGENEQQQDQQQQQKIDQQDLDLVDDRLEDEGKDEAALWSEFDAEESGQKAATDDGAGDGGSDDAAADGFDDGAADAGDDAGEPGSDDDSAATQQSGSAQDPDGKSGDGSKGPPSDDGRAQADEVWANATPEQRAAYDAAQQKLERLTHAERSNRGRISALQRQIAELSGGQRPSQQQADSKGSAEQQGQGDGAGSDQGSSDQQLLNSEDWKKFREEYPEVAAPLETTISGLEAQITRQNKELAAIGADRRENALAEQAGILAEEHSDWQEVVADDSFVEWLEAQPRHVREAAIRNAEDIVDAEEAADVVGRFKASRAEQQGGGNAQQPNASEPQKSGQGNGNQQARRQRQLESASTTRSRGPGVATGIPEDGDPERIWKQFDEMERKQAGGGT